LTNIFRVRILAESSERPLITYWTLVWFPPFVGEWDAMESPLARGLLHSHVCFMLDKHASVFCVDHQYYSVRWLANAQVHTLWERDQNDQAYMFDVYPSSDVSKIHHPWKRNGSYPRGSLYNGHCWCICQIRQSCERCLMWDISDTCVTVNFET